MIAKDSKPPDAEAAASRKGTGGKDTNNAWPPRVTPYPKHAKVTKPGTKITKNDTKIHKKGVIQSFFILN